MACFLVGISGPPSRNVNCLIGWTACQGDSGNSWLTGVPRPIFLFPVLLQLMESQYRNQPFGQENSLAFDLCIICLQMLDRLCPWLPRTESRSKFSFLLFHAMNLLLSFSLHELRKLVQLLIISANTGQQQLVTREETLFLSSLLVSPSGERAHRAGSLWCELQEASTACCANTLGESPVVRKSSLGQSASSPPVFSIQSYAVP